MTFFTRALRLLAPLVIGCGFLFLLAGTVNWPAAWGYVAVISLIMVTYATIIARLHPDLADERTRPPADAKAWDKPLAAIVALGGPLSLIILSGLDRRFHWSPPMPAWAQVTGLAIAFIGGMFGNAAVAANRFFSALIRIQHDRGHHVIDRGPYTIVRHPGYSGSILYMTGMAVALGSRPAIVATALVIAVLVFRTSREDQTLQAELEGYVAYTHRVRYRLFPGLW